MKQIVPKFLILGLLAAFWDMKKEVLYNLSDLEIKIDGVFSEGEFDQKDLI